MNKTIEADGFIYLVLPIFGYEGKMWYLCGSSKIQGDMSV